MPGGGRSWSVASVLTPVSCALSREHTKEPPENGELGNYQCAVEAHTREETRLTISIARTMVCGEWTHVWFGPGLQPSHV